MIAFLTTIPLSRRCQFSRLSANCRATGPIRASANDSSAETAPTPPVIFVLGGPGSGKGTQCAQLQQNFNLGEVCAGELLRKEAKSDTDLGRSISETMQKGEIVPGHVTVSLLRRELALLAGTCSAVLVDGFPREMGQAKLFEEMVNVCEFVLFFQCDPDVMLERLRRRAVTSGRADDDEAVFRKRFNTFYKATMPVVEHYGERGLVREVDAGNGSIEEVFVRTRKIFDDFFAKGAA